MSFMNSKYLQYRVLVRINKPKFNFFLFTQKKLPLHVTHTVEQKRGIFSLKKSLKQLDYHNFLK